MKQTLVIQQSQSILDAEYYARLQACAADVESIYLFLGPSTERLHKQQLVFTRSKNTINPDVRPGPDALQRFIHTRSALNQLMQNVQAAHPLVRQAYTLRLQELLSNLDMLTAASEHRTADFAACNYSLYGQPQLDVFAAVCEHYRDWVQHSTEPTLAPLVQAVLDCLPVVSGIPAALQPTATLFEHIRDLHWHSGGYFNLLFAHTSLPESGQIDQQIGDTIINQVLQNVQAQSYHLQAGPDDTWGVIHSTQQIIRPSEYSLTRDAFVGVIAHEIGSHLLERINGQRQPLQLLASGLDKYEAGNEGRALLREQIVYADPAEFYASTRWNDILRRHLAICLALGLDRHGASRSFSEVYAVLHSLDLLWAHLHGSQEPERDAAAATWQLLTRALKGTDGTGGAYLKDIVYLEGNVHAWEVAARNPQLIMDGDYGKFDIARPDHSALLQALNIRL